MRNIIIQEDGLPEAMDQETTQFLRLLIAGEGFREMARQCGGRPISTVRNRGNRLHQVLGLQSRLELANEFLQLERLSASDIQAHFNGKSHRLTRREIEVLVQVIQHPEQTRSQAAAQLVISEDTLRLHLNNIYRKTNTKNRYHLSAFVAGVCNASHTQNRAEHA